MDAIPHGEGSACRPVTEFPGSIDGHRPAWGPSATADRARRPEPEAQHGCRGDGSVRRYPNGLVAVRTT